MTRTQTSERGSRSASGTKSARTSSQGKYILIGLLFVIALAIPINLNLAGIRFTAYRLFLVLMFVPLFIGWRNGDFGKIIKADTFFFVAAIWGALTLLVAGVGNTIEAAGVFIIEFFGAYMLGRYAVRNTHDHIRILKMFLWVLVAMLPFAAIEIQTGTSVPLAILDSVFSVHAQATNDPRMGMERAQVIFEHPIHYGVFAASSFGFCLYTLYSGRGPLLVAFAVTVSLLSTLFSVSTGAYMMVSIQLIFVVYELATRNIQNRWTLFGIGFLIFYIILEIGTERTPFHWIVNNLSFSSGSAYNRIRIFEWGMVNIRENPIFGLGLGDWKREAFMSNSADNFWILMTMRHGIPMFILLSTAMIMIIRGIGLAPLQGKQANALRAGYLISMGGLLIGGTTVHYWNVLFVYLMFLVGTGVWMTEVTADSQQPEDLGETSKRRSTERTRRRESPRRDVPLTRKGTQKGSRRM